MGPGTTRAEPALQVGTWAQGRVQSESEVESQTATRQVSLMGGPVRHFGLDRLLAARCSADMGSVQKWVVTPHVPSAGAGAAIFLSVAPSELQHRRSYANTRAGHRPRPGLQLCPKVAAAEL